MKRVCILGACRTPIGKMGGALASVPAAELAALVIREAVRRSGAAPEAVDHVYLGCVLQAGLGQNVARQAALKAGLPVTATAQTVNTVCGSGLDAVQSAARMIQTGEADIVVAGGTDAPVWVYDVTGRLLATRRKGVADRELRIPTEKTGVYIVKIGDALTRRIVVVR